MCEQIVEFPVPHVVGQFVACFAEHIVAVPVPQILKGGVEVESLALHGHMCEEGF